MIRLYRSLIYLICFIFFSGCQEILYSDLAESDANEMVAVLSAAGVEASRSRDKDGVYSISVEKSSIAAAVVVLREVGLPRQRFDSIGDIFPANGIVGTPFEQHARFTHALNQELSRNITELDKVSRARVSVNLPTPSRYERETPVASASVTLHYEEGFDTAAALPKIKQIVSHSAPNLPYENVAVSLFQSPALSLRDTAKLAKESSVQPTNELNLLQFGGNISPVLILLVLISMTTSVLGTLLLRRRSAAPSTVKAVKASFDPTGRAK